jgi:hypothetical protein
MVSIMFQSNILLPSSGLKRPEDGDDGFLCNNGTYLPNMVSDPERP